MKIKMKIDGDVLGRHGEFVLVERVTASTDEWRNLKLVRVCTRKAAPKRTWWFGWNGDRLSRSADAQSLQNHQPKIHEWVISILSETSP